MTQICCSFIRYDHPDIIAGQGTMGVEIMEAQPDIDYIVVPIGGGGMVAGVVAAVKETHPSVKIIVSSN